ncbi:type I polyketide synthase [Streptomyces sp. NRRL S-237]|uniref:type I polyketide synthase n=1 Tax=Streptomyces sp. NRRL S-237 TaxID=1463895 RepID=UPI00099C9D83|nr:type I polyketide synthase [Streptomyces sp. NRRL S-237]
MSHDAMSAYEGRIAVIGMAGRFPGAADVGAFWENVAQGRPGLRDLTEADLRGAGVDPRWIGHPQYVRTAAALDDVYRFDAGLFGISPREAELMDPQHRLFLETCWEALEHAGRLDPRPTGASVGVFAGSGGVLAGHLPDVLADGGRFLDPTASLEHLGNDKDFLATRVSYRLGLTGPSLNVQTACSTSLVAVHLACQSLLGGECDTAVAGGVTVRMPSHAGYLAHEEGILSPDGSCRPFDAAARGTVFGSGVGAVVLKPLADALRDRDTVYAVIRGTAVNNDGGGKTSYGASSVAGQLGAMRQALLVADVDPGTIEYVEAHGTGTLLGDPLEITALSRALGEGDGRLVGSVKALVGHLEAAAGVAGLIKTVLALHHGVIPPNPYLDEPNPRLKLAARGFDVNRKPAHWQGTPRRAAVNSLGIGGTNAFAVLEQAPDTASGASVSLPRELITVSAGTAASLSVAARRWIDHLRGAEPGDLADLAHTAQVGRRRLPHQVGVLAESVAEAADHLEAWLDGSPRADTVHTRSTRRTDPVLLFSGQGSQYPGMAGELYASYPTFRASIDRHAGLFEHLTGASVRTVLFDREEGAPLLARADLLQPATYLLQIALYELWTSWGIKPAAVAGHSLGEYAAAHAAGVLTAEDGLRLVARRGRVMADLAPGGGMTAVRCSDLDALADLIAPWAGELTIAVRNTPDQVVLSGSRAALEAVRAECRARRWPTVELAVTHAFHSPSVAPAADALREAAARVTHAPARVPFIANLTGAEAAPGEIDADYWAAQLVSPVRFDACVEELLGRDLTHFVEVGPGTALTGFGRARRAEGTTWLASLESRRSDWTVLQKSLAELDAAGVPVDWDAFHRPLRRRRIAAPTYPFAGERHRLGAAGSPSPRMGVPAPAPHRPDPEAALRRVPLPRSSQRRWETELSGTAPFFTDHLLLGKVVVPGAYHTATVLEAASDGGPLLVEDLVFPRALVLADEPSGLHLVFDETADGAAAARVLGLRAGASPHQDGSWTTHAQGIVRRSAGSVTEPVPAAVDGPVRTYDGESVYRQLGSRGYELGSSFRLLRELRVGGGLFEADIALPGHLEPTGRPARAVLLDVCVQSLILTSFLGLDGHEVEGLLLPFRVERALFHRPDEVPPTARLRAVLRTAPEPGGDLRCVADVRVEDAEGRPLIELTGLELRLVGPERLLDADEAAPVHAQVWEPVTGTPSASPGPERWLVLADAAGVWRSAAEAFTDRGATCVVVRTGERFERTGAAEFTLDPADPDQFRALLTELGDSRRSTGVLHCLALDLGSEAPEPASPRAALGSLPALVRAWEEAGWAAPATLALVTSGAVGAGPGGEEVHPEQSMLWGAGRCAVLELADCDVRLFDADPTDVAGSLDRLPEALAYSAEQAREAASRDGTLYVPRLRAAQPEGPERFVADGEGCHLVTGGLGALGLRTAQWLARRGARHVVLTGRTEPGERAREVIAGLESSGVRVTVVAADVSDEAQTTALVTRLHRDHGPLRGVVHAAGVVEDAVLSRLDWDSFARVLAPKVAGARNLHRATAGLDLDHFVLYSSTAGLLGSAGQAHYAAGNGFLDGLALHRRELGLPALSVAWGPVTDGMTARLDARYRERMATGGFTLLDPEAVFAALDRIMGGPHEARYGVFALDWGTYLDRVGDRIPGNRGADRAPAGARARTAGATLQALRQDWDAASNRRREELVADYVGSVLAQRVGVDEARFDRDAPLTSLGLDSMIAIETRSQIRADLAVDLPLTDLLQDESARGLGAVLTARLTADAADTADGEDQGPAGGRAAEGATGTTASGTAPVIAGGEPLTAARAEELLTSLHLLDDAEIQALEELLTREQEG